ncbi:MAG: peptide chain release factor 2 [Blastochloris viridis]|uniref:Peptide chain release factor 2 n=1 Tax=Blastochloris viridis TaxID=1079 RepID=A0A6N4R7G8_BLAVI|nr:MAG: peptide chain release factor 2 [Blastochloris viridis]
MEELEAMAADGALWSDSNKAKAVMQEKRRLEVQVGTYDGIQRRLDDAQALIELGEEAGDEASIKEGEVELKALVAEAKKLEVQCLLGGQMDGNNAFLEVHAGAGGTESCDWAGMLLRMYTRWAERSGFKVTMIEETDGDQAGVKSATIQIEGPFAYGMAKTESGIHRLVRISPFDSNARRHTSFASVFVYPEVDDNIEIDLDMSQVRVDTYRSSGAGGQHVNTTDSAIRLTHIPTGIAVACQQDRSQHRNREIAINMLKARLYELEMAKQDEERMAMEANKSDNSWGHQIRSYVLQPYQMVKDLRTGEETSNTTAVLDGDIDGFIQAALAAKVGNKRVD